MQTSAQGLPRACLSTPPCRPSHSRITTPRFTDPCKSSAAAAGASPCSFPEAPAQGPVTFGGAALTPSLLSHFIHSFFHSCWRRRLLKHRTSKKCPRASEGPGGKASEPGLQRRKKRFQRVPRSREVWAHLCPSASHSLAPVLIPRSRVLDGGSLGPELGVGEPSSWISARWAGGR